MKEVTIGTEYTYYSLVTEDKLAVNVGSGDLKVFATPMMIAMMEKASSLCVKNFLDDGETTVGTYIEASHSAATPLDMKVYAVSRIIAVNGREIEFEISAYDEKGVIGTAKHKRFVVLSEKFQLKTDSKKSE